MHRAIVGEAVRAMQDLAAKVGTEIAVSDWYLITQEQVNLFAAATDDPDWMHIDVERAKKGPVGQTIAQGFLTLSLLLHFSHQVGYLPPAIAYAFNYGLDRVRWIAPVRVGARIRNRTELLGVTDRQDGSYLVRTRNTVEIEHGERPAMIAEWLGLVQIGTPPA